MRRLIIIANGEKVLSSTKREFIDSSDLVVRMNNIRIQGYEDFVGTKFDIYSCTPKYLIQINWSDEQRLADAERRCKEDGMEQYRERYLDVYTYPKVESSKMQEILLSYSSHNGLVRMEQTNHPQDKFPFAYLPFSDKIRSCNFGHTLKHTTGFKTILYCLKNYVDYEIFITGFDFYQSSGWYWDRETWPRKHTINEGSDHCYLVERERVNRLLKDGTLKEI